MTTSNWGDSLKPTTRSWIVAGVSLCLLLVIGAVFWSYSAEKGGIGDPAAPRHQLDSGTAN